MERTDKDEKKILARRRKLGPKYYAMLQALELIFGKIPLRSNLSTFVVRMSRDRNIPLDRASTRLKDGLICWLCEHCPDILIQYPLQQNAPEQLSESFPPFDSDDGGDDSYDKLRFD
jgi:hypothetical protein